MNMSCWGHVIGSLGWLGKITSGQITSRVPWRSPTFYCTGRRDVGNAAETVILCWRTREETITVRRNGENNFFEGVLRLSLVRTWGYDCAHFWGWGREQGETTLTQGCRTPGVANFAEIATHGRREGKQCENCVYTTLGLSRIEGDKSQKHGNQGTG